MSVVNWRTLHEHERRGGNYLIISIPLKTPLQQFTSISIISSRIHPDCGIGVRGGIGISPMPWREVPRGGAGMG